MNEILRKECTMMLLVVILLAVFSMYLFMKKPQKIEKIEVTQTADVVKDTAGFVMSDSVDCIDLAMPEVEWIIFVGNDSEDLMKFNLETGEIYWKDRLIITDKELVEGLRNIIQENRCPECKKRK